MWNNIKSMGNCSSYNEEAKINANKIELYLTNNLKFKSCQANIKIERFDTGKNKFNIDDRKGGLYAIITLNVDAKSFNNMCFKLAFTREFTKKEDTWENLPYISRNDNLLINDKFNNFGEFDDRLCDLQENEMNKNKRICYYQTRKAADYCRDIIKSAYTNMHWNTADYCCS